MRIALLTIGQVDPDTVARIRENLTMALPEHTITITADSMPLPKEAYDEDRQQHRSNTILIKIHAHAEKAKGSDRTLGIVDTDIYMPPLNFVFGEAESPGPAALISLWRLRPGFYGKKPDAQLLVERGTKEAVHELGHTMGLNHCSNPFCVMYFSNSIFETDRKQSLFCSKCHLKFEGTSGKQDEEP